MITPTSRIRSSTGGGSVEFRVSGCEVQNLRAEIALLVDDAAIKGATASTYTVVAGHVGNVLNVRVTFTDDAGNEESLTSDATGAVAAGNSPATGAPTISGTAQVGGTLTADTSGITDDDGIADAVFAYQWLSDDEAIKGAAA